MRWDSSTGSGPMLAKPTMTAAWVVACSTSPPTPVEFWP
jgi:hypothetical protein